MPETDSTPDSGETPNPAADTPDPVDNPTTPPPDDGLKKALDAERKARREAEKQLTAIQRQSMTDLDRAVAEAADKARREVQIEYGAMLVDSELRRAASDRPVNVDALLEGVDRARFITDDGRPDTAAIAAWMDRVAPKPDPAQQYNTGFPDLGQGARNGGIALGDDDALTRDIKAKLGIQ